MLDEKWEQTDWTRVQAEQVMRRMQGVLDQLPQAVKQAHERIIGERQVVNKDKVLSLYESEIHVIVRGKAGAEVEFGNSLFLAEQCDGFIVDHELSQQASREGIRSSADGCPMGSPGSQPSCAGTNATTRRSSQRRRGATRGLSCQASQVSRLENIQRRRSYVRKSSEKTNDL